MRWVIWSLIALLSFAGCGNSCTSDDECPTGYACTPTLIVVFPPMYHYACRKVE